ncbi:MAG TPA: 30S ribosomal protein S3 [Candidatus Absconditabacterales bacterium]|nr:30S ribosomal protein S3 [Candidatus Absconditabacterales bacterium]HNG96742.1 30S ribosomal protein S3 [Candidatus Absconditabacterales bacterium]
MGQKAHPVGLRVGTMKSWMSEWFPRKKSQKSDMFVEDIKLRNFISKACPNCGIAKIVIRKTSSEGELLIFTSKPAFILGKDSKNILNLETKINRLFGKPFKITLKEVRTPELSAKVMNEFIIQQIENRLPFKRVCKQIIEKVMEKGAQGIKIQISGRLNGVDIARTEKYAQGVVPLQTLRADIDYHYDVAKTKYGVLGVKVWICRGELFKKEKGLIQIAA